MRSSGTDRAVLVVEDDVPMREMMVDMLAEAGFATREACCAEEALDLLQSPQLRGAIAAIVTDIDMPGTLDGIGLAARVHDLWPEIGVVVTSGAHRGGGLLLRRPAQFLPKPFPAARLIAAVRSVLDKKPLPAQLWAS